MTSIKVCKYFIKSSPVGELHEVLEDINKVLGGGSQELLQSKDIKDALRDYYETHRLHLQFSNGETALVSAQGRQEPIVRYAEASYVQPKQVPVVKKGGLFDGDDEDEYGAETHKEPVEEPVEQVEEPAAVEQVVQSVEDFVYYDPVKKVKFSFNPLTLEARIEEEGVDWETQYLAHNVVSLR